MVKNNICGGNRLLYVLAFAKIKKNCVAYGSIRNVYKIKSAIQQHKDFNNSFRQYIPIVRKVYKDARECVNKR